MRKGLKLVKRDWFSWKNPPWKSPMGQNPPWGIFKKVYRVLNIADPNTEKWMVQVFPLYKAFIKFFTAWEKVKNWMSTIDFREKIPHGNPPWGKIPHGGFYKKCTGFSI